MQVEEVVGHVTEQRGGHRRTLSATLHPTMDAAATKVVRHELRQLKSGIMPGCLVKAPRPAANLRNLYLKDVLPSMQLADPAASIPSLKAKARALWAERYAGKDVNQKSDLCVQPLTVLGLNRVLLSLPFLVCFHCLCVFTCCLSRVAGRSCSNCTRQGRMTTLPPPSSTGKTS